MPSNRTASAKLLALSEVFVDKLARDYAAGDITIADWHEAMRAEIRRTHALQLIAGAGGEKSKVKPDDWLRLGNTVKRQYGYLSKFSRDIQAGNPSAEAISARAQMYSRAARESFWKSATSGHELPAHPGDGSSECRSNCGCAWTQQSDGWHWIRGKGDSCPTCKMREKTWNPYRA